ncbi:Brassinosteroid LRR receptor kinase BRL2 [Linum grandiflorum]
MNSIFLSILAAIISFFLITLIFTIVCLICKSIKSSPRTHHHPNHTRAIRSAAPHAAAELSSVTIDESASFDPSLNRVSMEELKLATKNFSSEIIIGDGSFGLVYKACLSDGVTVAIKKLDPDAFQGFREFRAEMETLGKLRHRNIVKMLGYCASGSDRVLIYEFVERGSLDQWLHDTSALVKKGSDSDPSVTLLPLSWETRNKIVRGVANGLKYLHGLDTPIIHRDIKASNVLLDLDFEAHIADFGLARTVDASHSHVSTQVAGTMGYMPPEYKDGVMAATVKADVYSFGILMFEIATGERPNLPMSFEGKEMGLIEWARRMIGVNSYEEMLDGNMGREGVSEEKVKEYFRIASMCCNEINGERPVMPQVVDMLNSLSA